MAKAFKPFFTKVVGVSYENEDGVSRQEILEDCFVGDRLALVRDPEDGFDPNAVRVLDGDGRQLGFLRRNVAAELAPLMDKGMQFSCVISDLTGGEEGRGTRGCNIRIQEATEATSSELKQPGLLAGCFTCLAKLFGILVLLVLFIVLVFFVSEYL